MCYALDMPCGARGDLYRLVAEGDISNLRSRYIDFGKTKNIGANIHEAKYAQSRADFISKLEIALKESSETEYWLEILYRKNKLSQEQYKSLRNACGSLRRRLIASVTTSKSHTDI